MHDQLHICAIQTPLAWEDKEANLRMFQSKLKQVEPKTHVVILPEMFTTGFSMNPKKLAEPMHGETVQWMIAMAKKHEMVIAGSAIIAAEGKYFNRFLWVSPSGDIQHYDKRHLFSLAGEEQHYTAGNERVVVTCNGFKILLQVCYDLRFPVWSRNSDFYDVAVYVANWPQIRSDYWNSLLPARAIENMAYVIGVNRVGNDVNNYSHSGDSQVISPLGKVVAKASAGGQELLYATLEKQAITQAREKFGFLNDADQFEIIC